MSDSNEGISISIGQLHALSESCRYAYEGEANHEQAFWLLDLLTEDLKRLKQRIDSPKCTGGDA